MKLCGSINNDKLVMLPGIGLYKNIHCHCQHVFKGGSKSSPAICMYNIILYIKCMYLSLALPKTSKLLLID